MDTTTVWVGDVDHLRQGCFYFYFRNASTFASLHAGRPATQSEGSVKLTRVGYQCRLGFAMLIR